MDNAKDALGELIHPLSRDEFLTRHWGSSAVYVRGQANKFPHLATLSNLPAALMGPIARGPVAPSLRRATYRDADGHSQSINQPPLQIANALFEAGMTLVFSGTNNDTQLAAFVHGVKAALQYPGGANAELFLSPDDGGLPWHYDANHNFVLQLEGTKRWEVGRGVAVRAAPFNLHLFQMDRAEYRDALELGEIRVEPPKDQDVDEHLLQTGDVLYVPPGAWHRTFAQGRSYSLSLVLIPLTFARVLRATLTLLAFRTRDWSEDLHLVGWRKRMDGPPGEPLATFLAERVEELRKEVEQLTPEDLVRLARLWDLGEFGAMMRMATQQVL